MCLTTGFLAAQEYSVTTEAMEAGAPAPRRRIVILDIKARVIEGQNTISWSTSVQKQTIAGTPVDIRLEGANVLVAVQFTPFLRRAGHVLVTQGQVWITDHNNGINYFNSIQTTPMEFDEPIHFFPLGQRQEVNGSSSIEIIVTVKPYRESPPPETINQADDN